MENELRREPATPEEIWAILREISGAQKKSTLDMEKIRKRQKQTDRQMKKLAGLFYQPVGGR